MFVLIWSFQVHSSGVLLEEFDFGHQLRRFTFKKVSLSGKVFFGIFAVAIFEVEVAEIFVELVFALEEIFEAGFFVLAGEYVVRPEGVNAERQREQYAGDEALRFSHGQMPPSMPAPVSRRIFSRRASMVGLEISAGCVRPPAQWRRSRIVPRRAAAKTAKGAIQATRSKPCVVGAASTVAPYLAAKPVRICSSVAPEAMAALSSSRMWPDSGQPTWLHSPRSC